MREWSVAGGGERDEGRSFPLVLHILLLPSVPVVTLLLEERDTTEEEKDCCSEDRAENSSPLPALTDAAAQYEHSHPHTDLPEVVRVAGHPPQAFPAPSASVLGIITEIKLLEVADGFYEETSGEQDGSDDVHGGVVEVGSGGGSVDEDDWETHHHHPNRLEHPEDKEPQRIGPLVVKP